MLAERYELRHLLGKGGMAEVHEAIAYGAHGFTRRVAIKRLLPDPSGDLSLVRMFLDEARITSKLHHAGIVSVIDYGVVDGAPFQVLELIDGWDAASLVRKVTAFGQTMPVEIALYIATKAAHALAYAHEATDEHGRSLGIVHRDVKPSNILVSRSGDVKLGDFGIAIAHERAAQTTGFIARGTPGFMAPEQVFGARADARTDIFALGCTVHALLTGTSPLANDAARAALLAGTRIELSPTLPPDVAAIVGVATRLRPDERPSSAREMAHHLGVALAQRLRTDPTTRMIEWLHTLGDAPRPSNAPAPAVLLRAATATAAHHFVARVATHADTTRTSGALAPPLQRPAPLVSPPPPTQPSQGTQPQRGGRGLVFAVALAIPLTLGLVAGAGLLAGRHLWHRDVTKDAGVTMAPAVEAGPVNADMASSDAAVADANVSIDASSPRGPASATSRAPSLASTAPVRGGCLCISKTPPRYGLCHPARVEDAPRCSCKDHGTGLCWSTFDPIPGSMGQCPDEERTLPPGTREGAPCSGYPRPARWIEETKKWETYPGPLTAGEVDSCHRCKDKRLFPRTPGAPCAGIGNDTGEMRAGFIDCD